MKQTDILVADSNFLVRQGLKSIFESVPDYKIVLETDDFEHLVENIKKHNPEVIVVGLNTPGISPKDVIQAILVRFPQKKVLVIDMLEDRNEIVQILQMGVHGYILKQCDRAEILDAVRTILGNKNFFCHNVIKFNKDREGLNSKLSIREVEILKLIAEGLTNNEIAERVYLSAHTIATHRKNLMRKLNAKNNVDLVISAIKESIIVP
ncbi:MAG: response regulator transcription factor [Chitinophagales bacterium]|nr:response regulator transcription factor [Chitinophagales bacterium]